MEVLKKFQKISKRIPRMVRGPSDIEVRQVRLQIWYFLS